MLRRLALRWSALPTWCADWNKPGALDMRIVKSAHRMVLEVAQRGASGRSVLASELVGEVVFSEWTSDGRLRQASWRGLRPDKRPDEVVRES